MQIGRRVALNHLVHVLWTCIVLLRPLIDKDTTQNGIPTILQDLNYKSRPVEHWISNVIRPKPWWWYMSV